MILEAYPYAVGDRVEGAGIVGVVTARPGPYSVTLDGRVTVSITMLKPARKEEKKP